jgi:REP element-mobilizing transposase RayT
MKTAKQLSLFKAELKHFGGSLLHGHRRKSRPLNRKDAIHLVIRSSWAGAIPQTSLTHRSNKGAIHKILNQYAKKYSVRIYQIAIVSNHIHLVLRIPNVGAYRNFIRVITGAIAEHVMRRQSFKIFKQWVLKTGDPLSKSESQGKGQQFWQFRPFTRILNWGRDYRACVRYLEQNRLEAMGFISYQPRPVPRLGGEAGVEPPGDAFIIKSPLDQVL